MQFTQKAILGLGAIKRITNSWYPTHLWSDPSVCFVLRSQLVYSRVGVEVHDHGGLPRLVVYGRAPYHVHQVVKGNRHKDAEKLL